MVMSIEEALLARTGLNGEPSKDLRMDFGLYSNTYTVWEGYMWDRIEAAVQLYVKNKDVLIFASEDAIYYENSANHGDLQSIADVPLAVSYCTKDLNGNIWNCSETGRKLKDIGDQLEKWAGPCGVNIWPMSEGMDIRQYERFARAISPYELAIESLRNIIPKDRFQLLAHAKFLANQEGRLLPLDDLITKVDSILEDQGRTERNKLKKDIRDFIDQLKGNYEC